DRFLLEPVTAAAIEFDEGWVLYDTGFNPETVREPALRAAHYAHVDPYSCYIACIPRGDPLLRQVTAAGLQWGNLAFGVISHLHCAPSGALPHFLDAPPIVIQDRGHAFALNEARLADAYFRSDSARAGLSWRHV